MKTARLHRLFNPRTARCFDVAIDHGFFNEGAFLLGIENLPRAIETLVAELLPHLLRHAGEGVADEGEQHGGWALRRTTGALLEPSRNLAAQGVRDGELSCTHMGTLSLYGNLNVRPATRFTFLRKPVTVFKSRRAAIYSELAASPQEVPLLCGDRPGPVRSLQRDVHG